MNISLAECFAETKVILSDWVTEAEIPGEKTFWDSILV